MKTYELTFDQLKENDYFFDYLILYVIVDEEKVIPYSDFELFRYKNNFIFIKKETKENAYLFVEFDREKRRRVEKKKVFNINLQYCNFNDYKNLTEDKIFYIIKDADVVYVNR